MATTPVISSIPNPDDTSEGLYQSVAALKQSVDIVHGNLPATQATKTRVSTVIGAAISAVTRLNP